MRQAHAGSYLRVAGGNPLAVEPMAPVGTGARVGGVIPKAVGTVCPAGTGFTGQSAEGQEK